MRRSDFDVYKELKLCKEDIERNVGTLIETFAELVYFSEWKEIQEGPFFVQVGFKFYYIIDDIVYKVVNDCVNNTFEVKRGTWNDFRSELF